LALGLCPAGDRQSCPDLPRIATDAEGRKLQPGGPEAGDGEEDGNAEEPAGTVS
jgi:hypothetical protein